MLVMAIVVLITLAASGCFQLFAPSDGEDGETVDPPPCEPPRVPAPPPPEPGDNDGEKAGDEEDEDQGRNELPPLDDLEEDISAVLRDAEGTYGIYFRFLTDDEHAEFDVRADEPFYAASCYKVPLVLYLFERAEAGDLDLDEKMMYKEDHRRSGAGILKEEEPGESYSLRYLASLSIIHSDNSASHMLLDRLGRPDFQSYQEERGAEEVCMQENVASPRDVGFFLADVLARARDDEGEYGEILEWLLDAYPRDRIPGGLPGDVPVASKTGTWPGTINDAAIVLAEDHPYLLVVMSEDVPDYEEGITTIQKIAEHTHEWVKETAPGDDE